MSLMPFHTAAAFLDVVHTISSNASDQNAYTLFGSPASPAQFRLVIASGVTVSASTTSTPALTTGSLPSGSTLTIVNNGTIVGKGGAGGTVTSGGAVNSDGSPGGNALNLTLNVTIDNTSGNIYGGGGGGGAGGYGTDGENFFAGTGGGAGAGPGAAVSPGGNGGAGGDYGASGSSGGDGTPSPVTPNGKSGGAAGKAVNLNGFSVTWSGGNNGTQVKGAVS